MSSTQRFSYGEKKKNKGLRVKKAIGSAFAVLGIVAMTSSDITPVNTVPEASAQGLLGPLFDNPRKFMVTDKCEDANDGNARDNGISGERGVPVGDFSKPMAMGEPGTKDTDGGPPYAVLTSPFGPRGGTIHKGIDISTTESQYNKGGQIRSKTPLYSTDDGIVIATNTTNNPDGYGSFIVIQHENEEYGDYLTLHGHIYPDEIFVESGDKVSAGQKIAYQGNNGQSSGLHDHFELRKGGGDLTPGEDTAQDPSAVAIYSLEAQDPWPYVEEATNPDPDGLSGRGGDSDKDDKDEDEDKDREDTNEASGEYEVTVNPVSDSEDDSKNDSGVSGEGNGKDVVEVARSFVGNTWYSQANPQDPDVGLDCSGLIMYSYKQIGYDIPRTTYLQYEDNWGAEVIWTKGEDGELDTDKMKPGDIIISANKEHAAMYSGNGKVIHSSWRAPDIKDNILEVPIDQMGSGGPGRVLRVGDDVSKGGGGSDSDSDRESGGGGGTCCASGVTQQAEHLRSGGQANPQDPGQNISGNAKKIVELGRSLGASDDEIKLAIAISMAQTGLTNESNDGEGVGEGNEQVTGEDIKRSMEMSQEGSNNDRSGRMGLFKLLPGKHGTVDDIMDKDRQIGFIFSKIKEKNAGGKPWNEAVKSLGLELPEKNYEESKDEVNDIFDEHKDAEAATGTPADKAKEGIRGNNPPESDGEGSDGDSESGSDSDSDSENSDEEEGRQRNGGRSNSDVAEPKCSPSRKSRTNYSADLNSDEIPEEIVGIIIEAANETDNITPPVLAAILYIESGFNPRAGNSMASGIAAFTPAAWSQWGDGGDVWNPEDAIPASARFLDHLYKYAEDLKDKHNPNGEDSIYELMAAAYNGGEGAIAVEGCGGKGSVPYCPWQPKPEECDMSSWDSPDAKLYNCQTYPYAKKKFPEAVEKFSK